MTQQKPILVLHPPHKVFADTYLITGNASESARKAGYSPASAGVKGNKLLKRPDIQEYLREQANKVNGETEDLQSQVLQELKTLAFADYSKFIRLNEDGEPILDLRGATEAELRSITSVASKRTRKTDKDGSVTEDNSVRIGLADKYRGLELLGKHVGMFKADEQRVVIDVADRLLAARRRVREIDEGGGGGAGV